MLTPPQTLGQNELQGRFTAEIRSKVPHLREDSSGTLVVNATPLVDLTDQLIDCARTEFGLELSAKQGRVFGKFESEIYGGSVKVRPAVQILDQAIASGQLKAGETVFEATSGNFGIALSMLRSLGFDVVALVSRKLQPGVLDQLQKTGVKLVNLDVDVCPAPGLDIDTNTLMAKTIANNLRSQLAQLGLDQAKFDSSRGEIEQLLARQDVINLAKRLAKIYGGFCPEQYDNELNVRVHETVTGPELDQQLSVLGQSLADFKVLCSFGTGGTSTGVARYLKARYDKRGVHVVFPLPNQEVGGIRTRERAAGLKFYKPELYGDQHEVDFQAAKRVLRFFTSRGFNIGESSALVLYACIQMLNYGAGDKFIAIIADGAQKYLQSMETADAPPRRYEVTFEEARTNLRDYDRVVWAHTMFVPKEEGVKIIAGSLGCQEDAVKVAQTGDVQQAIINQEIPESIRSLLPQKPGRVLLVCMVGATSLKLAKILAEKGIDAQSLTGGIVAAPASNGKNPSELVQLAGP